MFLSTIQFSMFPFVDAKVSSLFSGHSLFLRLSSEDIFGDKSWFSSFLSNRVLTYRYIRGDMVGFLP